MAPAAKSVDERTESSVNSSFSEHRQHAPLTSLTSCSIFASLLSHHSLFSTRPPSLITPAMYTSLLLTFPSYLSVVSSCLLFYLWPSAPPCYWENTRVSITWKNLLLVVLEAEVDRHKHNPWSLFDVCFVIFFVQVHIICSNPSVSVWLQVLAAAGGLSGLYSPRSSMMLNSNSP